MTQTPSRDWQKDMELCKQLNEWYEHEWEAGQEEGSRIIRIYETVPDEPFNFVAECENDLTTTFIMESRTALPYWLQEAKELQEIASGRGRECLNIQELLKAVEAREQRLIEVVKRAIVMLDEIVPHQFDIQTEMEILLSTLYPDTPAP